MSLQEALASLGIRPGATDLPPASLADVIESTVYESFPWIVDHGLKPHPASVTQLLDLHSEMTLLVRRIEFKLAMHGHAIVRKIEPPRVPVELKCPLSGKVLESSESCRHLLVDVDEQRAELVCRACDTRVNPMWWLSRYTAEISRAVQARESLREQSKKLREEVEALKKERDKHRSAVRRQAKKKA